MLRTGQNTIKEKKKKKEKRIYLFDSKA